MVRVLATAEDSLAAILERTRLGMAMAAMINMMATTISNSIRENPFSSALTGEFDACCILVFIVLSRSVTA
jgi:hypothetical protein